ncbi:MAG: hypothetical protein RTU92_00255 [Candidatus Thorarchaeota archaeon]
MSRVMVYHKDKTSDEIDALVETLEIGEITIVRINLSGIKNNEILLKLYISGNILKELDLSPISGCPNLQEFGITTINERLQEANLPHVQVVTEAVLLPENVSKEMIQIVTEKLQWRM